MFFKESQKFNNHWIYFGLMLLSLVTLMPISYGFYTSPNTTELWVSLSIVSVIYGFVWALFLTHQLDLKIDSTTIQIKFRPYFSKWKKFTKKDIAKIEVIPMRPIRDFGGWGLRWKGKSLGYIVEGRHVLVLHLNNGKKIAVSTKKSEELSAVIDKINQLWS